MDKIMLYIRTVLTLVLVGLSGYMLVNGSEFCQTYAVGVLSALLGYWFGAKLEGGQNGNINNKR